MPTLATPLTLPSGLVLPNRIAKAPMTENLADADNQPTARHEQAYRRWARGGAGLLVTGNLMVDRRYLERTRNIVADRHLATERLARVRAAAGSTPMIAQLSHPGRQTNRFVARHPVAPSAGDAVSMMGLFARPRALTPEEIGEIVRGFGRAASLAEQAGFDGVQVHAAHGYLLAQFLSANTNTRTDAWGGDVAGRARALIESVRACRDATGPEFTVAVKLNSSDFRHGGQTEEDAEQVVRLLVEEGIDLLEISGGTYESPALLGLAGTSDDTSSSAGSVKEAYFAAFATRARQAAPDVPIMLTGGIRTRTAMQALLDSGAVDVIGLGRPLALDPDLPAKLLQGAEGVALPSYNLPTAAGMAGESEWYEHQIGRLGNDQDPDPGLNKYLAAGRFVLGEAVHGLREGPRRRRLSEPAGAGSSGFVPAPLMRGTIRLLLPHVLTPTRTVAQQRTLLDAIGRVAVRPRGTSVTRTTLGGRPSERIAGTGADVRRAVLHLHGGAYVVGGAGTHRSLASHLAVASGAVVHLLDYRMGPEAPYPAAVEDALAAYLELRKTADTVTLVGDSAGGGLALTLMTRLRDAWEPLPEAAALISPWVDLTLAHVVDDGRDPMLRKAWLELGAAAYADGTDLASPELSPLFADLTGLPPLLVQAASGELLLDDAERLVGALRAAGVSVDYERLEGLWHDAQLNAGLVPAASAAVHTIGAFLSEATEQHLSD